MKREAVEKIVGSLFELHSSIMEAAVPEEAQHHFRASRREALLGMKALLQHAIDKCGETEAGEAQQQKKSSQSIEITE